MDLILFSHYSQIEEKQMRDKMPCENKEETVAFKNSFR